MARLTIVADPDGLLLEEGILEAIWERGYELIPFEDHVEFRYAYESRFRSSWDRGENTDIAVVVRSEASDLSGLPYDLLQTSRKLTFNLGDIFPKLSYPVVIEVNRGDLDVLFEAYMRHATNQLGDNATKEFILRHVFEITPELVNQPSDLLRVLLRNHFRGQHIPSLMVERFVEILNLTHRYNGWPLNILIKDREVFFAFLQERWTIFLDHITANETLGIIDYERLYDLAVPGPADLPFDHHDVRVYIDNLFVEGVLHPVAHDNANALSKSWVGIGVRTASVEDSSRRLERLIDSLQASIPTVDARHKDWFHFARGWAEVILLANSQTEVISEQGSERVKSLQNQMDSNFTSWIYKRYGSLVNLPPINPVMLHHLPRFLAHQVAGDQKAKIALIVVDGLAMDQWLVVRDALISRQPALRFREQAVFAWIPSLTSVSRQAIFSGKPPVFFPNSIQTTDKEPSLWTQFWADQGFAPNEVCYIKGLGDNSLDNVSEALSHPKVRVAGFVIDKIDKIMHGMEMGNPGMHNQVRQWACQPFLEELLNLLLDRRFCVYLTSDHGNVEAVGCGRPAEGAVAAHRGERVRIYPDAVLRGTVKERFPSALEWGSIGLPADYVPLLAPARQAFVQEKQRIVTHGGISVEELIVPLVQIEWREKR